jgi:hypothetical protein
MSRKSIRRKSFFSLIPEVSASTSASPTAARTPGAAPTGIAGEDGPRSASTCSLWAASALPRELCGDDIADCLIFVLLTIRHYLVAEGEVGVKWKGRRTGSKVEDLDVVPAVPGEPCMNS